MKSPHWKKKRDFSAKIKNRPKKKERDLFSVKSGEKQRQKKSKSLKQAEANVKKKVKKEKELKTDFEGISYQTITEGQIILGCIQEVHKYEMIISLPNGIKGHLPITSISRSYTELLSKVSEGAEVSETVHSLNELYIIGHLIITEVKSIVASTNNRMKVILSTLPEDVNHELARRQLVKGVLLQGAVTSVEEKGYVVDVGIKSIRAAFLSIKEVSPVVAGIGSVFLCVIKKILGPENDPVGIRIRLSAAPECMLGSSRTEDGEVVAVTPGVIVDAVVKQVLSQGLELSIEDRQGFVGCKHLQKTKDSTANYHVGQVVRARVLYVTDFTSIAYCTLNPRLCNGGIIKKPMRNFKIGDAIENAEIFKSSMQGVHLLLPQDYNGFCPSYMLQETSICEKEIATKYPVGSCRTCRITGANLIDQLFFVSLRRSILSEKIFGGEDLTIGQILKVKILEHVNNTGAVVAISNNVKGFIPTLHLTDTNKKNSERVYLVGQTYKARIIRHDPGEDPHLTLKKDLLSSNLPVVSSFDESNVGVITLGCIAKICEKGLLIELYNGCKAFMPITEIPADLKNLSVAFREGQIVKCKIIFVDTLKRQMIASLHVTKANMTSNRLVFGDIVDCKVSSVVEEKVCVSIEGKKALAYIPAYHLSDDVELSKCRFALMQEDDVIEGAVVFSEENDAFILSMKPSIFQHAKEWKEKNLQYLRNGSIFPSVVVTIGKEEVRVAAVNGSAASEFVLSKKNLVRGTLKKISYTGLHIGQTLFVRYFRKDKLVKLSSCLDKVLKNKELSSLQLLYNTIVTERQMQTTLEKVKAAKFGKVKIGKIYLGKVKVLSKVGVLVNISSLGLDGVIRPEHFRDGEVLKRNQIMKVRVLCINYKNNCLELTAKKKKLSLSNDHHVKVGQNHICEVLLAGREYILGRLKREDGGQIVYLPAKRHMNDFKGRHSFYTIGKNYEVKIKYVLDSLILADLLWHCHTTEKPAFEPLNLHTEIATIKVRNAISLLSVSPLTLDEAAFTRSDFRTRAKQKISRVAQFLEAKRHLRKTVSPAAKLRLLRMDEFPQFDDEFYWDCIAQSRKERKKLKPTKVKVKVTKCKEEDPVDLAEEDTEEKRPVKRQRMNGNENISPPEGTNCLQINSNGFDWSGQALADNACSSGEETSIEEDESAAPWKSVKRLTKFERDERARAEERKTRQLELQRLNPDRQPETALDYEESVEKNPHSSAVWIEYISFHLENAEMEKARMVADSALKRIPPALDNERLAVWNVILRLEVMFGTPESVQDAFKEAIITNDELKIFYLMIDIYSSATKLKEGENVINRMIKKYSQCPEVWVKAGLFFFKSKELNEARKMLERALISLPKQEHVDIINRFAQFELKFGDPERGKTIFEKLLSNFPKRLDIWNVYADSLHKLNDISGARNVLERMTGLKLRMKAMRNVFKKLLEFEKEHGTPQKVEAVKVMVEKYVEMVLKEDK